MKKIFSFLLIFFVTGVSGQDTLQRIVSGRVNGEAARKAPYVVLISADGFRHDYAEKYHAENILGLARQGVRAESMVPSFPSVTFPNHYSIVTGLYPSHHGLVANTFYDPQKQAGYSMSDKPKVRDGSWYGGTPIWVLAEQQQMLSACMYWVGSEAAVKGIAPTYSYYYSERIPNERRIAIVKEWLSLPEGTRPHLITFYMSEPDHAGHRYGPEAPETESAVKMVDSVIFQLTEAVRETGLPVNFVFVSDHGMTAVNREQPIPPLAMDSSKFKATFVSTMVSFYAKNEKDIQPFYDTLKKNEHHYKAYLKTQIPAYLHYGAADDRMGRIGDIILIPEWPYVFGERRPGAGHHGFDPAVVKDMHAVFMAWGPAFKNGMKIPSFENVHVYPLLAEILKLKTTEETDGRLEVLRNTLK